MTIEAGLAGARDRAAAAIARAAPGDVRVAMRDGTIALTGRALRRRALADPRLRDFAGVAR